MVAEISAASPRQKTALRASHLDILNIVRRSQSRHLGDNNDRLDFFAAPTGLATASQLRLRLTQPG